MATVAEVMTTNVLTVDPTASIGEAAEKMMEAGVGAVVVMEDMVRLTGIVTERDILRAVAQRARAAEARVRQWMTESVITIEPETTVEEAAKMMFERNFRHLPVVQGRPAARDRQPPPPLAVRVRAWEGVRRTGPLGSAT